MMTLRPNRKVLVQGLALLTLSWDKNWDSHSLVNGYPSFYPRIALVAPSPDVNTVSADGLVPLVGRASAG